MLANTSQNTGLQIRQTRTLKFWSHGENIETNGLVVLDVLGEFSDLMVRSGDERSVWGHVREVREDDSHRGIYLVCKKATPGGGRLDCTLWGEHVTLAVSKEVEAGTYFFAPGSGNLVVPSEDAPRGARCLGFTQLAGERTTATFNGYEAPWGYNI